MCSKNKCHKFGSSHVDIMLFSHVPFNLSPVCDSIHCRLIGHPRNAKSQLASYSNMSCYNTLKSAHGAMLACKLFKAIENAKYEM